MKITGLSLLALSASIITARFVEEHESNQKLINIAFEEPEYLIELTSGETQWVTETEKWQLRGSGQMFMDITDFRDLGKIRSQSPKSVQYPDKVAYKDEIFPLLKNLNKSNIQSHLEYFTTFHNRFYNSKYGEQSFKWLLKTIEDTVKESGADKYGITVKPFEHSWDQHSIILTIPGKNNSTVIIGAHQDSVNHADRYNGRAPGADDDGSGTMTILEVLRTLLGSKELLEGKAENTVEFHWYAGEEGGMLGSQAVFAEYEKTGRDVKAMLQQDMTGFIELTVEAGKPLEFGLMVDYFDKDLMEFAKLIIGEYTSISWVETVCGRCGSDHMSALRAGYPAIFIIEAEFENCDNHLHGDDDLIKYLDFDHMVDHAQLSLGFIYELAFAQL